MDLQIQPPLPNRRDFRIGILGSGFVVNECHLPAYRKAGFNPVAIASRDRQKAEATARRHAVAKVHDSYDDLLNDPSIEVLDLAVPPQAQLELIKRACARKTVKGILAQKPLGINYREAVEAAMACERAGIVLSVNQNMRYDPSVRAAKTLLDNGVLGTPVFATIEMRGIPHWQPWQAELGWATLRILSIHHLDCFRYWFGGPEGIYCSFRPDPRTRFAHQDGICTYILDYGSGLRCVGLDDPWTGPAREGCPADIYLRWRIEGLNGLAIGDIGWCRDPYTTPSTIKYASKGDLAFHEPKWTESWFPDAFIGTMAQLLIALETGRPPAISAADNLKTMALVEAAYQSAHRNLFMTFNDLGAPEKLDEIKQQKLAAAKPARGTYPAWSGNFTPRAQKVMSLAQAEADGFHQGFVLPEHVLLGILKLGNGPAFDALTKSGLTLEKLREEIGKEGGIGAEQKSSGDVPYGPRVHEVVGRADHWAKEFRHTYVGTEAMLLALLDERDGVVPIVLKNLALDVDQIRREVRRTIGGLESHLAPQKSEKPGFFSKMFSKPVSANRFPNNFTPRAQQSLALARREADRFNHNFVGTEHVLLGLIKLGQGVAVTVLQKLGLDLETVRREIERQVGLGPKEKMIGNIPYTPRVKKVLVLAGKEAKNLNHTYVGTEHILLGLLREGDGVAGRVLKNLGVDAEQTRREILRELNPIFTGKEDQPITETPPVSETRSSSEPPPPEARPTPYAGRAMRLAREEAERFDRPTIGPEHILTGLMTLRHGLAYEVLLKLRLDLDAVRSEAEKQAAVPPEPASAGKMSYSEESKEALAQAYAVALRLHHDFIGTEHILLGLIDKEDGVAARILKNLGADPAAARAEVLKEIARIFGK